MEVHHRYPLGGDVRARSRSAADLNEVELEFAGALDPLAGTKDGPHIVQDRMAAVGVDGQGEVDGTGTGVELGLLTSHWSATGTTVSGLPEAMTRSTLLFRMRSPATRAARLESDWLSATVIVTLRVLPSAQAMLLARAVGPGHVPVVGDGEVQPSCYGQYMIKKYPCGTRPLADRGNKAGG